MLPPSYYVQPHTHESAPVEDENFILLADGTPILLADGTPILLA